MKLYVVKASMGGEVLTKPLSFTQCEHFIREGGNGDHMVIVPVLDRVSN